MSVINLAARIRRGEIAIAAAKAQGRDVTDWEQHLETLKRETIAQELPPSAWIAEEIRDEVDNLRAVRIRSAFLEDQFWLIIDRTFKPQDNRAVYYPEELHELRTKTPEQLREIHKIKLAFPSCRVIQ
jgi:hypothetical protein